jgi:TetR/AcrR family transcriptional regulator
MRLNQTDKAAGQHKDRGAREDSTEQRILDAAHNVFVRRGTAGARMQDIADEAGVNKALLHYYFRSKERLAEAVFRRVALHLMPPLLEILASDDEIEEKVAQVVELELTQLARSPYVPAYVISELSQHRERMQRLISNITGAPPEQIRKRVLSTLRRQIDGRVRAGTMRSIAPEQFVINLLSLCIFPFAMRPMLAIVLAIDDRGFERMIERRRAELVPFFLAALRP